MYIRASIKLDMQTLQRAVNIQSLIRKLSESKLTASVSLLVTPPMAITVLSVTSAILTGNSARFV